MRSKPIRKANQEGEHFFPGAIGRCYREPPSFALELFRSGNVPTTLRVYSRPGGPFEKLCDAFPFFTLFLPN